MKKCESLSGIGKALLVASPALSGSFPRIPFGGDVERTGGRLYTVVFLVLTSLGMTLNTILAYKTIDDLGTMENFSGLYFLWMLGGFLAGFGICTFCMISNVLFWSRKKSNGYS